MAKSTTEELLDLYDYAHGRINHRLTRIDDAEYLWEPVAGCWSLRLGADGAYYAEMQLPDPDPAPFTTIAWRIWHIGGNCLAGYNTRVFERRHNLRTEWPGTAADGIAAMNAEWDRFRSHIAALDDDALARPLGEIGGSFKDATHHAYVLHAIDEVIHHGGEIGVMRDLYRATGGCPFGE